MGGWRTKWLERSFWIFAGGDVFLTLVALLKILAGHGSGYDTVFVVLLLGIAGIFGAIMLAFALVRSRVFRGIALASAVWPMLQFGIPFVVDLLTPPIDYDRQPAHLSFAHPADGALADAIAAGDGKKVAELAPAADLNAVGYGDVTFMQLALGRFRPLGPPKPTAVAALLKAGADPGQSSEFIFRVMVERRDMDLLRAVVDTGVDLNGSTYLGQPRFFMLLDWPEGLAVALDHGASTEAEDKAGKTAIMLAFPAGNWADVDSLLVHGARADHADHTGRNFRDAVQEVLDRYRRGHQDVPPQLAALEARLK